jgi:VWFA-related protein
LAFAQTAPPEKPDKTEKSDKADDQNPPLRIVTNEVRLPLRAFDPLGKRVMDLSARDVIVVEDGAGCPVTSLNRDPSNVMLVLDLSGPLGLAKSGINDSDDKDLKKEPFDGKDYTPIPRPAAQLFAEHLARALPAGDRIAILQYADKVELLQDWTPNPVEAVRALRAGFRSGSKARFYDALAAAAERLQAAPKGQRVLVLVTDGLDTASVSTKQAALERVAASGASVFVVSWAEILVGEARRSQKQEMLSSKPDPAKQGWQINSAILSPSTFKRRGEIKRYSEQVGRSAEELKALAEGSGGEYWLPKGFAELRRQPAAIVSEIGAQYTLTYLSKKDQIDGAPAAPELFIARPGLSVRTRKTVKLKNPAR